MKSTAGPRSLPRRTHRRWRVPPAILHGPEHFDNVGVLDEHAGEIGVVLWQSLRDVTLWASTPPSQRRDLFCSCAERSRVAAALVAGLDPELDQPLGMIAEMVGSPDEASPERISLACRQISQWAEERGKLATSMASAQAAATVCPGDASLAYKVGRLARKCAAYPRAESWYRRAIALGRQEKDWTSYSLAFSGLGNLYQQRGSFPKARAFHTRALRAAKRHGLKSIQGDALFELHVLATASGQAEDAQRYARVAFDTYGTGHPRIPTLAHDVAYFWLTQGHFAPALAVFRALIPEVGRALKAIIVLPNMARAAGGLGDRELFQTVWDQVWENAGGIKAGQHCAEAFLELSRGAQSLGNWDQAEAAATRALELAGERGEARIQLQAEALLQSIQNDRLAQANSLQVVRQRAAEPRAEGEEIGRLAEDFVRSLHPALVA